MRICSIIACVQVFVANPNKPDTIVDILTGNKDKLLKYLGDFHTDKGAPASSCCQQISSGCHLVLSVQEHLRLLCLCRG